MVIVQSLFDQNIVVDCDQGTFSLVQKPLMDRPVAEKKDLEMQMNLPLQVKNWVQKL